MTAHKKEHIIITIEAGWHGEVVKRLTKAATKAEKFGLTPPTWEFSGVYEKQKTLKSGKKVMAKVMDVTVENTVVKLQGRELVASMETTENGNFLKVREGFNLPERFRRTDCYCDHCKTDRMRKHLYVFLKDDGTYEQVGSTCLKDYMGFTPAALAYAAAFVDDLRGFESESWGFCGGRNVESMLHIMSATKAVIEHQGGYISRAAGEANGTMSTTDVVMQVIWPRPIANPSPSMREWIETVKALVKKTNSEENIAGAREAIRFLLEDWTDTSNYAHNVRLLLKNETFTSFDMMGVATSSYGAYLRAIDKLVEVEAKKKAKAAEQERARELSKHQGEVGDRLMGIVATVTANFYVSSNQFGDTFLIKFEDTEGNLYSWFTSGKSHLKVGTPVALTGTVKDHRTYKDIAETQLTRCKVEVLEQEEAA